MKYDDASWHYEGQFPDHSPMEYSATHIALLLKWCFKNGMASVLHRCEFSSDYRDLLNEKVSASDYFMRNCDGKLTDEDFNEEGNLFMSFYYGEDDLYLKDYASHFGHIMYLNPECDHDSSLFSEMVSSRFNEFKKGEFNSKVQH